MKKILLLLTGACFGLGIFAQGLNLPYYEDFESSDLIPANMTLVNGDQNTPDDQDLASMADSAFIVANSTAFGGRVAMGVSFYNPEAGANDWLITPQLALTGNSVLSWKALSLTSSGNYPDTYHVLISTTTNDTNAFLTNDTLLIVVDEESIAGGADGPVYHDIDLAAEGYANQDVYIAFRLYTPYPGGDRLAIDDIKVIEKLEESFDTEIPASWTIHEGGANGSTWIHDTYDPHKGDGHVALNTYKEGMGAADDWLVSPKFTLTDGYELSIYAKSEDATYTDELSVFASKGTTAIADFTVSIAQDTVIPNEYVKLTYVLTDHADLAAGDEIYIGFKCTSNGYWLYLDEFRYGEEVLPMITNAYALSENSLDVVFDVEIEGALDPADFELSGTANVSISTAEVDATDKNIVHLVTSATMTADNVLDKIAYTPNLTEFDFYAGVLPLSYASLTNPDGTIDADGHTATFKGIVMAINSDSSKHFIQDAAEAHHGINTHGLASDAAKVGDEVLLYGKMSPYQSQTEIYPATIIEVLSSDNALYEPVAISSADIEVSIADDTDPAEKYEGLLVQISNAVVDRYDGEYFIASNDATNNFYIGNNTSVDLYNPPSEFTESLLESGKTYNITGIVINRAGSYKITPRNSDDIEIVSAVFENPASSLKVFPNPVSEYLFIESENAIKNVQLINLTGKVIKEHVVVGDKADLDVRGIESGLYILKALYIDGEVTMHKVTIK